MATPHFRNIKHVHFVGIAGCGMGGMAELMMGLGYQVSGSDLIQNAMTRRLQQLGACVCQGHDKNHLEDADVVVYSHAVSLSNPELMAAKAKPIPVINRVEMLAELMRFYESIVTIGSHGKTTTSSLIVSILSEAKLDPTWLIGGCVNQFCSHGKLGKSRYFVAEADESQPTFLNLQPTTAVLTNIDDEHLEAYGTYEVLKEKLWAFLNRLPFFGLAVLCVDDPTIASGLARLKCPLLSYGFSQEAAYRATQFKTIGLQSHFRVVRPHPHKALEIRLNLPGKYNVLNALAAIAVGTAYGVPDRAIIKALAEFQGVVRRFELLGHFDISAQQHTVTLIDDYGHHPREIDGVIGSLRKAWPDRRIVMLFQPHRYTRTGRLFEAFAQVLSKVDRLILLDIYPASEPPIPGVNALRLCEVVRSKGGNAMYVEEKEVGQLEQSLKSIVQTKDVILLQGAGSVTRFGAVWKEQWKKSQLKTLCLVN